MCLNESVLSFVDIIKTYPDKPDVPVLDIGNFELKKGEHVAIIGEIGSGKTTFAKIAAGLLKPESGEVKRFGSWLKYDKKKKHNLDARIGYLSQKPEEQVFNTSVYKEVVYALKSRSFSNDLCWKMVENACKIVDIDLDYYGDLNPFTLSEGELRRVGIASSIVYDPELLILDEPAASLDNASKNIILTKIFKRYSSSKNSLILITHDFEIVLRFFNRVVVLREGKIICDCAPIELIIINDFECLTGLKLPFIAEFYRELMLRGINLKFKCKE